MAPKGAPTGVTTGDARKSVREDLGPRRKAQYKAAVAKARKAKRRHK